MQLSLFGLLLLTQPLNSSEQDTRANLEFSSNFDIYLSAYPYKSQIQTTVYPTVFQELDSVCNDWYFQSAVKWANYISPH